MMDKQSQFPVRLQGIWRAGSQRPSDYVPAIAVARAQRHSQRAEARADAEALLGSAAHADPQASPIAQELQEGLGRLASLLGTAGAVVGAKPRATSDRRRLLADERAAAQSTRDEAAARASDAAEAVTARPASRRSGIAALAPLVFVFIIIAAVLDNTGDLDLEYEAERLMARGERWLWELFEPGRPMPGSNVASEPQAIAPVASSAPAPVPASLVRNGSFEQPPLSGAEDARIPDGWRFEGNRPYLRRAAGSAGYPAADGSAVMTLEGERHGRLYQDLGLMQTGATYTFRAQVLHASGRNAWRAAFWRIDGEQREELAWTSERKVAPPEHGSFPVTFSYTATAADGGRLLRLVLSDNASGEATRAAIDDVVVRAER